MKANTVSEHFCNMKRVLCYLTAIIITFLSIFTLDLPVQAKRKKTAEFDKSPFSSINGR